MEEGIILLLILFLVFNVFGADDLSFADIRNKDVDIEEDKILGNEEMNSSTEANKDLFKVYKESIQGNASINLDTKDGDIYTIFESSIGGNPNINLNSMNGDIFIYFKEKITGNLNMTAKTNSGDIHIVFHEKILGNPTINLESNKGKIIFYNDQNTINKYNIKTNAYEIQYRENPPKINYN